MKAKAERFEIHQSKNSHASDEICRYIEKFIISREEFKIIATYMPIQTEIDVRPVMSSIRALKRSLCLPVITSEKKPLDFKVWNETTKLIEGKFKVLIPLSDQIVEPDLILCPMLSFDSRGYRLGYGGGFYDRYIEKIEKIKKVVKIGLAFSCQKIKNIPLNQYDKKLDFIVTEKEILK